MNGVQHHDYHSSSSFLEPTSLTSLGGLQAQGLKPHYYKNMVFMLLASCLKWLYNQYLEYTSSLKWLNVFIMTKIKSSNVQYDKTI
jgi:hypothetical protein